MSLATLRAPEHLLEIKPDGVAAVRRSGRRPHRVLMFGGGVLRGLGLRDHNLGLPGHLADALAQRSGRGVDLDVIVDAYPTSPRALNGLHGLRLRRFDAVIVFLGARSARIGVGERDWRNQMEHLTRTLRDETAPGATVILCDTAQAMLTVSPGGPSRRAVAHAARLSAITAAVGQLAGYNYVELHYGGSADLHGRFTTATYAIWADTLAARAYPKLQALEAIRSPDSPAAFRRQPDPEGPRQNALAQLRLRPGDRNPRLVAIVQQAKAAFRAEAAYLTVIEGDLQWAHASTIENAPPAPRATSFCDHTIRTDGLTLINDSWFDPRVRDYPGLQDPGATRFYAAYPIHSWDGYRVGALCIVDSTPRNMLPSELGLLQDLTGRIEQELWASALRDWSAPQRTRTGVWM